MNDSPERVAGGLALGAAIGILPTFGLGTIIAFFISSVLKLNKASAVTGTLVMNPWTAPFFWTLSYLAGSVILGYDLHETVNEIKYLNSHPSLLRSMLGEKLIYPYLIGNLVVTVLFASFFYVIGIFSMRAYRNAKRKKLLKKQHNNPFG